MIVYNLVSIYGQEILRIVIIFIEQIFIISTLYYYIECTLKIIIIPLMPFVAFSNFENPFLSEKKQNIRIQVERVLRGFLSLYIGIVSNLSRSGFIKIDPIKSICSFWVLVQNFGAIVTWVEKLAR